MSQDTVAMMRQWAETYNQGDLDGFLSYLDPRVAWEENHPLFGFVGLDAVYKGHEGVRRWWATTREPWQTVAVTIHEVTPGDNAVVVHCTMHGTGAGSGADVDLPFFQVFDLRGGKVSRRRLYPEREEALQAAELDT